MISLCRSGKPDGDVRLQELRPAGQPGRARRRGRDRHPVQQPGQAVRLIVRQPAALAGRRYPEPREPVPQGGKATFTYGAFLTEAITFLIAALVVYYVLVMPVSRLLHLLERNQAATTRACPECTLSIPIAAQRCLECTAVITPGTHQPQPLTMVGGPR